jgi:hypothetical protein
MAQLGDLARAKALLRRAARAFGLKEAVAPTRGASSPRPRSRSSRATWAGLRRRSTARRDARRARRPGQRRVCALSRGPAPPPDRAHRGGRAYARRARPRALPSRGENCPRAGGRGDRDAAPPDEGSARCARSGRRPRRASFDTSTSRSSPSVQQIIRSAFDEPLVDERERCPAVHHELCVDLDLTHRRVPAACVRSRASSGSSSEW